MKCIDIQQYGKIIRIKRVTVTTKDEELGVFFVGRHVGNERIFKLANTDRVLKG